MQRGIEISSLLCGACFRASAPFFGRSLCSGRIVEDLVVDIPPFPHPAVGEKVFPAEATQSVLRLR